MTKLVNDDVLINGRRIACGVHGEGTPVVLIHGTPFFSHIWRKVLPRLLEAGYRVHLYDLLGFGHSERPQDPAVDTSISAQLPVLTALLDYWQLERTHVVAHDIGAAIAQQLGIFHPERVSTMTLIDSVSFDSYPSPRTRQQMQAGLDRLIATPDSEHRAHFTEWVLSAAYNKTGLAEDALATYVEMISGPIGQGSLFQHQIRHYDPVHTLKLNDRLVELGRIPLQLIWGADDEWQVTDWAYRLQTAIPGSSLHILEQCGHLATEDQPQRIADLAIEHMVAHTDREHAA